MKLFEGEEKILESDDGDLVLTTHRLRHDKKSFGKRKITSILLNELSSCELSHRSHPILLILAILGLIVTGIATIESGKADDILAFAIPTFILFIAYFLTRRQVMQLSTAGSPIVVALKGMKPETVKEFIDETEIAKNKAA